MLETEAKTKAKILGKRVESYLVGQEFEVAVKLTNIGSAIFPGGSFIVSIEWPNGQTVQEEYQIPMLNPGEVHKWSPFTTGGLSRGFALFTLQSSPANDGKPVNFHKPSGELIPSGPPRTVYSFFSILAKEPEEIYEFWGMIVSAVSLAFLVGIELTRFLIWLSTHA
jgi:hypothetical protein